MLPLANRRILITRPVNQASSLAADLEALGATPILIPTIEIVAPPSYASLDDALARLATFDWLIFTSANGAKAFGERARAKQVDPYQVERIAAIGPATAAAVGDAGLPSARFIPSHAVAESLAEMLVPEARHGVSMLLVRASRARDVLPEALIAAGARLTIAEAYSTVVPAASIPTLQNVWRTAPPDAVTFTSASTVQNLAALLESAGLTLPPETVFASIGPITSEAMREAGFPPTLEARESKIKSLVEALSAHFTSPHFALSPAQLDLLAWKIPNEVLRGLDIDLFDERIGASRSRVCDLERRLQRGDPSASATITIPEAKVVRNALSIALEELGPEEFQARTGYDFEAGKLLLAQLDEFKN